MVPDAATNGAVVLVNNFTSEAWSRQTGGTAASARGAAVQISYTAKHCESIPESVPLPEGMGS